MKVRYQPWCNPLRPWRVDAPELYQYSTTSRFGLEPDWPWYEFNTRVAVWLDQLSPVRVIGRHYRAVSYLIRTKRFRPLMIVDMGRMKTGGKQPPPIWFARKDDVLLFKLTWGGSI